MLPLFVSQARAVFKPACAMLSLLGLALCGNLSSLQAQAATSEPAPQTEDIRLTKIRAAEQFETRSGKGPLPIPAKLPLITHRSNGDVWHAFCVRFPKMSALVAVAYEDRIQVPRFNEKPLKPGRLLKHSKGEWGKNLWVWELPDGPATTGAGSKQFAGLPLLREGDELVIVTQAGHRRVTFEPGTFNLPELLPNEPHKGGARIVIPTEGFKDIQTGYPVFHKRSGELIGAVTYLNESVLPGEPNTGDITFLDLSVPTPPPIYPLTHLWGIPVKASPAEDQEIFTRVLPMHATQDVLGDDIAEICARRPYLSRKPHPDILSVPTVEEPFASSFTLSSRQLSLSRNKVYRFSYFNRQPLAKKETDLLARWLVQKFGEPSIYEFTKDPLWLLAIWTPQNYVVRLKLTNSDRMSFVQLNVEAATLEQVMLNYDKPRVLLSPSAGSSRIFSWLASAPEKPPVKVPDSPFLDL
ncbi:hypothetical protein [Roseimicrobium sp. ORNL1]|uniref:hypothetical protein n=1 Tax=Roseimicrobium sp. ORNL1 TaxID=2711231 RepID=UPI0013E1727E|nr:hypothetical protein [Roseimicrobium sp. ORNL1]QIF01499.1 hypothetical protein G5S37_08175 [Roseimicrobium sp. ORNL1]